ncbi:MAG: fibronectin type III domain-containing protein, partial [Zoogloeaceae bacterium]|nr:fibronectin type III domain-containing protein [Zoogloeaceae bacterium]
NEWAEQNHLVVLFPQAASSMLLPMNPNACWDWWGYNDTGDRKTGHFATREGFQIAAVWRMAEALAGSDSLTDDAERAAPATHAAAPGTRLEAPVAEVLETSSTQTLLTWKATPGAAAYRVYRSTSGVAPKDGGKSDFLLVSPKNLSDTAYVDGDLTEKTHYQYRVAALDEAGREVASSPLAAETLKSPPACDPYFSMLAGRPVDRHGLPTKVTCK